MACVALFGRMHVMTLVLGSSLIGVAAVATSAKASLAQEFAGRAEDTTEENVCLPSILWLIQMFYFCSHL